MLRHIFSLLTLILFFGCAGVKQPKAPDIPSWILNPNTSNSMYYYAVGQGRDLEESKNDALKQISSEISITISSMTSITKILNDKTYSKTVKDIIKASTNKINFTNIKILKRAVVDGIFYTYIQVDRSVLFQSQKEKMLVKYNQTIKLWNRIQKSNIFILLSNYQYLIHNINEIMGQLSILKSINNNFMMKKYVTVLQDIKTKAMDRKSKAIAFVKTNSAFNEKSILEKALSDFGIKVIKKMADSYNKQNLIIIYIQKKSKPIKNRYKSWKMRNVKFALVTLIITTYDGNKKLKLAQNIIRYKNASRDGYDDAVKRTKNFVLLIKQKGIINTLLENTSK